MESDLSRIWCASRRLIGTMIGVGMLSLPFAVVRDGLVLGLLELLAAALVSYLVLRLYADLIMIRGGKARFIHVLGRELGHFGTGIASFAYIGATLGALIAFLIFGGQFLRVVLFDILPLKAVTASVLFFILASFFTIGGSLFIGRVQRIFIPLFMILIGILVLVALPHMSVSHFELPSSFENIGLSFGMMLFAFHGIYALPEMRDILGRHADLLPRSIGLGSAIVFTVYVVFILSVLGVTGLRTTENAIPGLGALGHSVIIFASAIALLVTFTVYMNVASALTNTFLYDLRMRFIPAWLLTAFVPLFIFLAGAQHISSVLSITGGVLGSLTGIMMLIAYERARVSAKLPKNSLQISQWAIALTFLIFFGTMVATVMK